MLGSPTQWCVRCAVALVATLVALVGASTPSLASAEPKNAREYKLKAAFVYNFTKFIRWPETAPAGSDDKIVLCVLADDFVREVVRDTVKGKPVRGNPIEVRPLSGSAEADLCHLVFVGASQRRHLKSMKERTRQGGVLVVSEAGEFGEEIAMINLIVDRNKVRFEIDVDAADQAGLRISSKLLKLATIVQN